CPRSQAHGRRHLHARHSDVEICAWRVDFEHAFFFVELSLRPCELLDFRGVEFFFCQSGRHAPYQHREYQGDDCPYEGNTSCPHIAAPFISCVRVHGSVIRNVLPLPSSLSSSMDPPCTSAAQRAMESP